ncbi:MAG: hypothetical protein K6T94_22370 [Paenibacillus sp.]|nr:hypothetical protein [Paenibacillus sp.]
MMISLSVSSIPTPTGPPGNPNPATGLLTAFMNKAMLTKAMWLLFGLDVLGIFGIIALKNAGVGMSDLGMPASDVRVIIWIVVICNIVLVTAYATADIIINFLHGRGIKD